MTTFGAYEAKTHFSRLLEKVRSGETIGITWHGMLVGRFVPATDKRRRSRKEAAKLLREMKKVPLKGLTIRQLIDDGRKY